MPLLNNVRSWFPAQALALSTLNAPLSRRRVVLVVNPTPAEGAAQFMNVVMDHRQVANPDYTRAQTPSLKTMQGSIDILCNWETAAYAS